MRNRAKPSDINKPWNKPKQKSKYRTRSLRERILIVCEGEKTEPNYFGAYKNILPLHSIEVDILGEGKNTLSLVDEAIIYKIAAAARGQPFDQVWVVFDRDSFQADDFDNAIHKADSNKMRCAWSNEAFELWYLLHFEYRNTAMSRTEYSAKLEVYLGKPYRKNSTVMFEKLQDLQMQAIAFAKKLHEETMLSKTPPNHANPCSTVYQLVEELNKHLTQEG